MEIDTTATFGVMWPHRYCRECKALLKDYGGKKHLIHPFGTLVSDVWTDIYRIRHTKRRDEHPCQLPIHLLERLILMTTDAGDIVLDPFIGTGTTAIAAKRLARNYIGVDIDKKYVSITKEKLEGVTPTQINGCYLSFFLDKIVTLRDLDYEKVQSFLEPRELKINASKSKRLTLPVMSKKALEPSPSINLSDYFLNDIKTTTSNKQKELVHQNRLLEKCASYKVEKTNSHDQR